MISLEEAQDYADQLFNCMNFNEIDNIKLQESLETLAKNDNEAHFRTVIDSFVRLSDQINPQSQLVKDLKDKPLAYLEFLLLGVDHTFTKVGYSTERLPRGETQAYFNKLYGDHL